MKIPQFSISRASIEKEIVLGDYPITQEVTTDLVLKIGPHGREISLPINKKIIRQLYEFFCDLRF